MFILSFPRKIRIYSFLGVEAVVFSRVDANRVLYIDAGVCGNSIGYTLHANVPPTVSGEVFPRSPKVARVGLDKSLSKG